MFSYVCEKCGREVPPSYSECPDCAEKAKAAAAQPAAQPVSQSPGPAYAPQATAPAAYPPMAPPQAPATPTYSIPGPAGIAPAGGTPAWLVTALVAAVLILGGYILVTKILPSSAGGSETAAAAPASEATTKSEASALKYVEVAGLRISEKGRKAQISLVVINHATAELTDINVSVVVRTKGEKDKEPLARLPLELASLDANEVRNVTMDFPTELRAYELPDWQFLEAEVAAK